MLDGTLTALRHKIPGDTTQGGDEPPRRHHSLLGPQGEVCFRVLDSSARPGEPLCRSLFPFSVYVFRLLQDLQNSVQNGGQGGGASTAIVVSEEVLRRNFGLLQLGGNLQRNSAARDGAGCPRCLRSGE